VRTFDELGRNYDAQLLKRLLHYLLPYKRRIAFALSLSLLVVIEAAPAYLFHIAIDSAIEPVVHHRLSFADGVRMLDVIALLYLAVLLITAVVIYGQVRIMQTVGQRAMYDLRRDIFIRLQELPISFHDQTPVGRLVTRVTSDVGAINQFFSSDIVAMLNDAFVLIIFTTVMIEMNWRLALVAVAIVPITILVTRGFRNSIRSSGRRIRAAIASINSFLQEHISGMTTVQMFNRKQKALQQFSESNRECLAAYKDTIKASALFSCALDFLVYIIIACIFWYGGLWVLAGSVKVGVLVAFTLYAQRFFRPIQNLSEKFGALQSAMASFEGIVKLLDEPVPPLAQPTLRRQQRFLGHIEFRNVWFSYSNVTSPGEEEWVLRDVSFCIHPGEMIAIVGHTGAGKTTAFQLLLRFYEIQRGEILIDGTDIRQIDTMELRRHFGVVLQDPFLFAGTIESNVRFGTMASESLSVEEALRKAGLGDLLESLPQGIYTPVTERGSNFSVGQQQLINVARALAHRPEILILDEATSSVDTNTELLIREALAQLFRGRTSIVIAHRFSTIEHADRILVFHKGRLCEEGTHGKLLSVGGIYSRLYLLQHLEQEVTEQNDPNVAFASVH
jgi:ATP-binding cassette subfamily B multidrug efflux pump